MIKRQGSGVARDLHRPQAVLRRRRRAHVPGALAEDREDRGREPRRRPAREALLPARPRRPSRPRPRAPLRSGADAELDARRQRWRAGAAPRRPRKRAPPTARARSRRTPRRERGSRPSEAAEARAAATDDAAEADAGGGRRPRTPPSRGRGGEAGEAGRATPTPSDRRLAAPWRGARRRGEAQARTSAKNSLIELVMIVAVALGLALAIQAFLVKPFRIPSRVDGADARRRPARARGPRRASTSAIPTAATSWSSSRRRAPTSTQCGMPPAADGQPCAEADPGALGHQLHQARRGLPGDRISGQRRPRLHQRQAPDEPFITRTRSRCAESAICRGRSRFRRATFS